MSLPESITNEEPSWAELSVCALAQVAIRYRVKGECKKQLRTHSLIFSHSVPAALSLPRVVSPDEYMVVFANLKDSEVEASKKSRLLVRKRVTDQLLEQYSKNISLYRDIPRNKKFFTKEKPHEKMLSDNYIVEGESSTIMRDLDSHFDRPGTARRVHDLEISTASTFVLPPRVQELRDLPAFRVDRSDNIMDPKTRDHDLSGFPHLHSNGLATIYDPKRAVYVAPDEVIRHFLSLHNRQFATDPLWLLVNFDNRNKDKSQGLISVRFDKDPGLIAAAHQVSREELLKLARHQHECQRASLSGLQQPRLPFSLQNAQRVLSNLKIVQGTIRCSEQEREEMRRTMYGATYQMGPGHCMITLTPSETSNGMAITIAKGRSFTMELDDVGTVERTAKIEKETSKDPAACATYFSEIVSFFLTHILGYDVEKRKSKEGLIGKLEFIGGGIETQGSQRLHCHLVARIKKLPDWLENILNESDKISNKSKEHSGQDPDTITDEQFEAIAIHTCDASFPVFNLFQFDDDNNNNYVMCPNCTTKLEVQELTIFHKSNRVEQEPYVALCEKCNQKFTASRLRDSCIEVATNFIGGFALAKEVAVISTSSSQRLPIPDMDSVLCKEVRKLLRQFMLSKKGKNLKRNRTESVSKTIETFVKEVLISTFAQAKFQEHSYRHFMSCFKKGIKCGMSVVLCRYNSPRKPLVNALVTTDGIEFAKTSGSEYLNPNPKVPTSLTKSNGDVRFLRGASVDYSTKYSAKPQGGVVDNDVLLRAINRSCDTRERAEKYNTDMDAFAIGKARVRSLLYNVTNYQQVDATLAAYCLLHKKGPFIFSHKQARLGLFTLISIVKKSSITVTLKNDNHGNAFSTLSVTRYIQREEIDLSLFEFLVLGRHEKGASAKKKKVVDNSADSSSEDYDSSSDEDYRYGSVEDSDDSSSADGHSSNDEDNGSNPARQASTPVGCPSTPNDRVVIIHGFTWRPKARRNTEEKEEEYSLAVLICFVPFNELSAECILRGKKSFTAALKDARKKCSICPLGIKYIQNMETVWDLKFAAQERAKEHYKRQREEANANKDLAESVSALGVTTDSNTHNGDDDDNDYNFENNDTDLDMLLEEGLLMHESAATRGEHFNDNCGWSSKIGGGFLLQPNIDFLPLISSDTVGNVRDIQHGITKQSASVLSKDHSDASSDDGSFDEGSNGSDDGPEIALQHRRPLTVTEINENSLPASKDCIFGAAPILFPHRIIPSDVESFIMVNLETGKPAEKLPTCASLNEVSRLFEFVEDQHRAFTIVGRAFLSYICIENVYFSTEDAVIAEIQRLLLLHGMAGTGKSRVIQGCLTLATSWTRGFAIGTFAITGVAAINVKGETFARLTYHFEKTKRMTDSTRLKRQCLRILIIDEISMADLVDLTLLDNFCRSLTSRPCLPYGGITVLFAGDFCQLKPVGGQYLYMQPPIGNVKKTAGFNLWRTVTNDAVVVLSKMQRTKNEAFTKLQKDIRVGKWTRKISSTIGKRVHAKLPVASPEKSVHGNKEMYHPENSYCPVLVTTNQTRANLELKRLHSLTNRNIEDDGKLPILLLAKMVTTKRTQPLSKKEKAFMFDLPDSNFQKAAPYLAIYPGAWMLITYNINVFCGLGQGTRCRVVDWPVFEDGTTFEEVNFKGCRVRVPSTPPQYVYVEVTSTPLLQTPPGQPSNLPENVVAFPLHNHRKSVVNLSGMENNRRKSVTVRLRQLPLRPANVLTTYAVQSAQFQRLIIYETNPSQFYTQLSRACNDVKSVSLANDLKENFRPSERPATEVEMQRLAHEHNRTKIEFKAECQQRVSANKAKSKTFTKARAPKSLVSNFKEQNQNEKARKKNRGNREEIRRKKKDRAHEKKRQGNESSAHQQSTKKERKNVTRNGLVNIGNTCYLNATVQMIISSRSVTSFLRGTTFDTQEPTNELYVLKYLESKIRSSKTSAVTLKNSHHQIIAPTFPIGEQNDPSEFLSLLMDSLSNINVRTNGNITDNFFTGSTQDTRVCSQCNFTQTVPSVTFNMLMLPIDRGNSSLVVALEELIKNYMASSDIPDLVCSQCLGNNKIKETKAFVQSPNCLIIQLLRFSTNGRKKFRPVHYPFNIELPVMRTKYELVSVVRHIGKRSNEGHYMADVKDSSGSWSRCNDSSVSSLRNSSVLHQGHRTETPYLLMYTKK